MSDYEISDEVLREMSERAHMLDELARHPGWPAFTACAEEELVKWRRAVLSGELDHDRYVRFSGMLAGGEMVANIPRHMMELYLSARARRAEEEAEEAADAVADR